MLAQTPDIRDDGGYQNETPLLCSKGLCNARAIGWIAISIYIHFARAYLHMADPIAT